MGKAKLIAFRADEMLVVAIRQIAHAKKVTQSNLIRRALRDLVHNEGKAM